MEYLENTEARLFREEVRDWLHAHRPRDRRPDSFEGQMAFDRAWQRTQFDGGWAGIAWPEAYGGRGLPPAYQLIWCEEYAAAGCPPLLDSCWLGINHAGPTLIACGTEAQKREHLPRILRGEATWCQGFSEPNAGSDLASLRSRARLEGDELVVNGQKTWTTFAHLADYQELLVRTGEPGSRHRGLAWVICDMRSPGIDVRPMRALNGDYHNCEVFYDEVRIPLSQVVGELDGGWAVAMATFSFERGPAMFGRLCELEALLGTLTRELQDSGAVEDSDIAVRLGQLRARMRSLKALAQLMVSAAERDVDLGAEAGIFHLPFAELAQAVCRLAMEAQGAAGLGWRGAAGWVGHYLESFSHTIAGGTAEIQRNIIGERLLGLPR